MSISSQLKKLREKHQLTVAECANSIGVSHSIYRDWENGRSISGEPYLKMARLFGVSLSELFELNEVELSIQLLDLEQLLLSASETIKNIRSKL